MQTLTLVRNWTLTIVRWLWAYTRWAVVALATGAVKGALPLDTVHRQRRARDIAAILYIAGWATLLTSLLAISWGPGAAVAVSAVQLGLAALVANLTYRAGRKAGTPAHTGNPSGA